MSGAWLALIAAGIMEVAWVSGFKQIGPARPVTSALVLAGMALSFLLLWVAMRTIPVGTAYAVWTGIGAVGAALLGMALYGEPRTALRLVCIALIVAGIVGLKLSAGPG